MAKLVSWDMTRPGAVQVMKRALDEFVIEPVKTTIPLYRKVMDDPEFQQGRFDTGFIKRFLREDVCEDDD